MKLDKIFSFLTPKEGKFYPLFKDASANLIIASELLVELMNENSAEKRVVLGQKIKESELVGDQIAKNLYMALNSTFITPFDREDIFDLIHATDSVVDLIFGAAKKIHLYNVKEIPQEFKDMADTILRASIEINTTFNGLRDVLHLTKYKDNCHKISDLEEYADDINHRYLAKLFQEERDAIELIKKKDVLQALEKAVDRCDDVADIISSVIVKIA
jgi:predicted phosphate transport protein (TIGR00153 family)